MVLTGKLELRGGEALDDERRLPPKRQYYTDKHHFHLHHFTKQKVVPLHHPTSTENHCFLLSFPLHPFFPQLSLLQVDQLVCNELFESLQVLSVELHVIVSCPLHPEWLHGALTPFIQRQAMGEVNDLVLCTVDHQHR